MAAAVLLVDDERFARTVYSDYLRVAGYEVQVADTADAALEALRRRRFDLLITDIILPGADGLELLSEAKRLDSNIEALVITALDRVDPSLGFAGQGADDPAGHRVADDEPHDIQEGPAFRRLRGSLAHDATTRAGSFR